VEYSDLSGGGVANMPEPKDKVAEESHITKTPEYRRFKKLLKKVVKAPPLRKRETTETHR
jgi:hypothetical protein